MICGVSGDAAWSKWVEMDADVGASFQELCKSNSPVKRRCLQTETVGGVLRVSGRNPSVIKLVAVNSG